MVKIFGSELGFCETDELGYMSKGFVKPLERSYNFYSKKGTLSRWFRMVEFGICGYLS
jgi:hypothetical protein